MNDQNFIPNGCPYKFYTILLLFLTSLWIRSIERFKQHGIPWAMDTHLSIYAHEVLHKHPVTNNTQSSNMDRSKWLNARTPNRPSFYQRWCIKIWNTPIITEENLNTKYGSTQIKHQSNAAVITQPKRTIITIWSSSSETPSRMYNTKATHHI